MYYPYLYGRAAELDAVAAAADDFGNPQQIVPVIEPAAKPDAVLARYVGKLTRTLATLKRNGAVAYVVTNPHQGLFVSQATATQWQADMAGPLADRAMVRPAFKVHAGTTSTQLAAFLAAYRGHDLGLVVANEIAIPIAQLVAAVGAANVHLFVLPGVDSGDYVTAFGANKVVRTMGNFNVQVRNADYFGNERLAINHLANSPAGFADFTILPSILTLGGGRAGAAVIHLTFKVTSGEFWVEHFVSDETDRNVGTFQSKLLEALDHMDADMTAHPAKFEASPAVLDYLGQHGAGSSTSQGKNKELQIRHHLYVVARHLGI